MGSSEYAFAILTIAVSALDRATRAWDACACPLMARSLAVDGLPCQQVDAGEGERERELGRVGNTLAN